MDGNIEITKSNTYFYKDSLSNDMIVYTGTSNQHMLFGTTCNDSSAINIWSSNITFNRLISSSCNITVGSNAVTGTSNYVTLQSMHDFATIANTVAWPTDHGGKALYMRYSTNSTDDSSYIQSISRNSGVSNLQNLQLHASNIFFATGNSNASVSVTIRPDGKVGLGTTLPQEVLHIVGNTRTTGFIAMNSNMPILFASNVAIGDAAKIGFNLSNSSNFLDVIGAATATSTGRQIYFWIDSNVAGGTAGRATFHGGTVWLDTGSLGVGVSNPISKVQITSNSLAYTTYTNTTNSTTGIIMGIEDANGGAQIFNTSNHYIKLGTSNVERMKISAGGLVGIGVSNPVNLFHIHQQSSTSNTIVQITNANTGSNIANGFQMGVDTSKNTFVNLLENAYMWFGTNNTERARITAAGNVGIRQIAPSEALHVTSNVRINGLIGMDGNQPILFASNVLTGDAAKIGFNLSNGASNLDIIGAATATATGRQIYFWIDSNVAAGNAGRATFHGGTVFVDTGSIGVGISNPNSRFQIASNALAYASFTNASNSTTGVIMGIEDFAGGAQIFNTSNHYIKFGTSNVERMKITGGGLVGVGVSNPVNLLHIHQQSISSNTIVQITNANTGSNVTNGLQVGVDTSKNTYFNLLENAYMWFGTNSTEKLRIDAVGNVGIGTVPSYKLDVNGDINFNGILRQGGIAYIGSQWSNTGALVYLNGSNVVIQSNVTLCNILSNLGNAFFASNVLVNSNLYVNQQVVLSNTLSNLGNSFFASNVLVNSNLYVNQQVVLSNTLSNLGTGYFNTNLIVNSNLVVGVSFNSSNTLSNLGAAFFASNVLVNSNFYVNQQVVLSNTLSNLGNAYFASNVLVNSNITLGGGGYITKYGTSATWFDLPTTGPSGIGTGGPGTNPFLAYVFNSNQWFTGSSNGDVVYRNVSARILLGTSNNGFQVALSNGIMQVFAPQSNFDNISISSNVVIGSNLYVNQQVVHSNIMSNLGNAYFASNVLINSNLIVSQQVILSNTLSNLGTGYFNTTLIVNSNLVVGVSLNSSNTLCNLGSAFFASNVLINSNLYVNQQVVLSNTLSNLGNAFFASNVLINSNLYVNQQVVHSNTMSNLGNAYFASNVFINSNLIVSQQVILSNSLSNLGNGYFNTNLIVNSNLVVGVSLNSSNTFSNLGAAFFASNVLINSNFYVNQQTILSNSLSNLGNAYFASNVLINSNLYVNQQVVFSNTMSNLGNAYYASNVVIKGNLTSLSEVTSNLTVYGATIFGSNLTIDSNVYITQSFAFYQPPTNLLGSNYIQSICVMSNAVWGTPVSVYVTGCSNSSMTSLYTVISTNFNLNDNTWHKVSAINYSAYNSNAFLARVVVRGSNANIELGLAREAGTELSSACNMYAIVSIMKTGSANVSFANTTSSLITLDSNNYQTLTYVAENTYTRERFITINSNTLYTQGNVGLGTSNPIYPLDIAGTMRAGTQTVIASTGGEAAFLNGTLAILNGRNDAQRFISALDYSMTNNSTRFMSFGQCNVTGNSAEFVFLYYGNANASNSLAFGFYGARNITCLYNGNNGIGTSNPAFKLDVNGDINFTGVLRQGGSPYIATQWSNNGALVFLLGSNVVIQSNVSFSNSFSNLGNAYFASNIIVNSNLYVNQQVVLSNTLSNLGNAYFASNIIVNSNLYVNQQVVLSNTLSNLGNAYFASNIIVNSNLYVNQQVVLSNTLSNLGNAYFASNIIVNSNLYVNQQVVLSNTLSNLGNAYFASNIIVNSNLYVNQQVVLSNTLSNLGNAYFASNIIVNSNLYVNQQVVLSNTLSNLGNAYFASNLSVNGQISTGSGFLFSNNLTTQYPIVFNAYSTALPAFGQQFISFGKTSANLNSAQITYNHIADSSTSNYGGLGIAGINPFIVWNGFCNVGIRTSNPQYALDVSGDQHVSSNMIVDQPLVVNDSNFVCRSNLVRTSDFGPQMNAVVTQVATLPPPNVNDIVRSMTRIISGNECFTSNVSLGSSGTPTDFTFSGYFKTTSGTTNMELWLFAGASTYNGIFTANTSWQRFSLSRTGLTGSFSCRIDNNFGSDLLFTGIKVEKYTQVTPFMPYTLPVIEDKNILQTPMVMTQQLTVYYSNLTTPAICTNSNAYVGIGTSTPSYALDILGDINFSGTLRQGGSAYVGSQWSNNSSNVFLIGSNVGLGTSNPSEVFEVRGNSKFTSNVYIMSNLGVGKSNPTYTIDVLGSVNIAGGALLSNGNPLQTSRWTSNASGIYIFSNVGIQAIANPNNALTVGGHIVPSTNISYDLGTSNNRFRDLYLNGSTVYLGGATIQADANSNVVLSNNLQLASNLAMSGFISFRGIQVSRNNGQSANISTQITSIPGFSNTSNGITFNINSNLSTYKYSFTAGAAQTEIMSVTGDGAVTTSNLTVSGTLNPFSFVGIVLSYAGSVAPSGWLLCFGQAVSRAQYSNLFATIGVTYGVGDGSTSFNIPDMRGRIPIGLDNMGGSAASRITSNVCGIVGTQLGASGGDQRLHAHTHTINDAGHSHTYTDGGNNNGGFYTAPTGSGQPINQNSATLSTSNSVTGISINNNSQGGTAQNIQPAIVMNYIIKF